MRPWSRDSFEGDSFEGGVRPWSRGSFEGGLIRNRPWSRSSFEGSLVECKLVRPVLGARCIGAVRAVWSIASVCSLWRMGYVVAIESA